MKKISLIDIFAYIFIGSFIVAGIAVSLGRFWQYEVFYYDFGIFDRAIWEVSRFKAPIIDHLMVGEKWIFADHFNPSIFLLSPFYWLTSKSEMILVVQSIIAGLSGLVLYNIGNKILKNQFLAFSILACYLLFTGLQNAVIFDFHDLTVATLPFMLTFWAAINRKLKLYFIFLIVTLGFKESLFTAGVGIGLFVLFMIKEWKKIGIATIIISIIWGIVSIKYIIPAFSNSVYNYSPTLPKDFFGLIKAMYDSPIKIRTLFYSFLSFGFLPFLAPSFWPLIIQDYAMRFLPAGFDTRWDLGLHYNAQSAVILAVSAIFGLKRIIKFRAISNYKIILGLVLFINAFILYRFILNGPLALAYNPAFYKHTKDFAFLDELVSKIPADSTVMTQNNLAVRFTHQKVWTLKTNYIDISPEYILIDNRKGQNANDFFPSSDSVDKIIGIINKDHNYKLIYNTQEQFVYKKYK